MPKRLTVVAADALLSVDAPEEWIVKPLLAPGSTMMLYGRQGTGKTTLALQLSAALATGSDWLAFATERVGSTLWLQLDMPRAELKKLLVRADARGLFPNGTRKSITFAQFWEQEQEIFEFDILADADHALLLEAVSEHRPLCLIVDTANDTFQARVNRNEGAEVRRVLRRLRGIVGSIGGTMVYLQHQRKPQQGIPHTDRDAYLGRVEWETVASTSLQLQESHRKNADEDEAPEFALVIRKSRLADPGFRQLNLQRDRHGFFLPQWTAQAALACWPRCVPQELRAATGREAICDALEQAHGFSSELLRVAIHRAAGRLPWKTV